MSELSELIKIFMDELGMASKFAEKKISTNKALSENAFLMTVCAELRIPLFIVGKPGTSKSLARSIVAEAMQGVQSSSELFRSLKQVHHISYQCSPLSTADGILKVFRDCSRRQRGKNLDEYVCVAVLDEVGLAEDSSKMALKALHPLLEGGCSPDGDFEHNQPFHKVAFYGISNWSLDPAKMNRGILVSRDEPDEQELINTGSKILVSDGEESDRLKGHMDNHKLLEKVVATYYKLYREQGSPEVHGLRDFYCLLKMVASMRTQEVEK